MLPLPHFGLFFPSWNSNHIMLDLLTLSSVSLSFLLYFIFPICLSPWAAFWIRSSDLASLTNCLFSSTSQIQRFVFFFYTVIFISRTSLWFFCKINSYFQASPLVLKSFLNIEMTGLITNALSFPKCDSTMFSLMSFALMLLPHYFWKTFL